MPGMDGFQVCKILREDKEFDLVPIIVISAFNDSSDRTKAFELGADDYIAKPFEGPELIARIQRKLKSRSVGTASKPVLHNIELDPKNNHVKIDSEIISLSSTEFRILQILVTNFEKLVTRDELLSVVWEQQEVSPRLMDPHILTLRNKFQETEYSIQSVYGKGYILKRE